MTHLNPVDVERNLVPADRTGKPRRIRNLLTPIGLALLFLAGSCYAGQPTQQINSDTELSNFMQTYYLHPHPELVASAIKYIGSSKVLESNKSGILPAEVFFSVVFSRYPSRRKEWSKLVAEQSGKAKETLEKALRESPQELIDSTEVGPALIDTCWAAYFASGKLLYLNEIIAQLRHLGERKNLNLYLAAAGAEWSLSSVSREDRNVKMAMLAMEVGDDPKMRAIASDILNKTPDQLQKQMIDVLQRQHERGIW